jgi:hypothetical protein
MGLKIARQGSMYIAEVTPPHERWLSPGPMTRRELEVCLKAIGFDERTIDEAFCEEFSQCHRNWAEQVAPLVIAALDGSRAVKPQSPSAEAWLTYALFIRDKEMTIQELIEAADFINHLIPNSEEISWTFLQLRKRGWLVEHEGVYGLTENGRHSIQEVVTDGELLEELDELKSWIISHPV